MTTFNSISVNTNNAATLKTVNEINTLVKELGQGSQKRRVETILNLDARMDNLILCSEKFGFEITYNN